MSPKVTLTSAEILLGAQAGAMRQVENMKLNRTPYYGAGRSNDWQLNIEGVLGEMAVAKHIDCFWYGKGVFRGRDVGNYEVRSTAHQNGRLILHPDDDDDAFFFLVVGAYGQYTVAGKILGRQGKVERYWSDPTGKGRPAFFVPQSDLVQFDD